MNERTMDIYVATHKRINYNLPSCYKVVQVNCKANHEHWDGYLYDDYSDNISEKNASYCELTALYQAWKNSDADIKGLCHYRRFFGRYERPLLTGVKYTDDRNVEKLCLDEEYIDGILDEYDAILQMPCKPYPNSARDDLQIWCYSKDILILEKILRNDFPEYIDSYEEVMQSKFLSYCNMMIAKRDLFDGYCIWLFDVLERVEEQCDISDYDVQHKRIYGYLAEVLLNVYAKKNAWRVKYLATVYVENQDKKRTLNAFIHKTNFVVFNLLEELQLQVCEELIMRFYKKEMYENYKACSNNFLELTR